LPPAALITGGAKRIGRAIALALAREGYDLAVHYNRSADAATELADEIARLGRRCELFQRDLADAEQVAALVPDVVAALPDCNVLVNNASIFQRAGLMDTDADLFDRHFAVNFRAPFFLSQAFARHCRSGQIVNLLDTTIARTFTPYFAYALTKKALADFTKAAAKALGPHIRVNGVCPGLILPPSGAGPDALEEMAPRVPLRRVGDPEAVAAAVVFLVRNDYITGQSIFVDGGEHLT